jgi:hypothetical protein
MAIEKSVATSFGTAATYWRITSINADMVSGALGFTLSGYLSQATREAGNAPIESHNFGFVMDKPIEDVGRADLYAVVKAQDMFAGAVDV